MNKFGICIYSDNGRAHVFDAEFAILLNYCKKWKKF